MGRLPGLGPYVVALGLTLALETPVYATLLHVTAGLRWLQGARLGLAANAVSHPLVFLVIAPLMAPRCGAVGALAIAETTAVSVELLVVKVLSGERLGTVAGTSYVANALSFSTGLLIFVW